MFSKITEKIRKHYPELSYRDSEFLAIIILNEIKNINGDSLNIGITAFENSPTLSPRGRLDRAWKSMVKSIMQGL